KNRILNYFLERFSNPPLIEKFDSTSVEMTYAELNEEVVTDYKNKAPTLSHLFVLAGILDPLSQDPARQNIQSHIIEVLVQDHLRSKKNYALDPMASVMLSVSSFVAKKMG